MSHEIEWKFFTQHDKLDEDIMNRILKVLSECDILYGREYPGSYAYYGPEGDIEIRDNGYNDSENSRLIKAVNFILNYKKGYITFEFEPLSGKWYDINLGINITKENMKPEEVAGKLYVSLTTDARFSADNDNKILSKKMYDIGLTMCEQLKPKRALLSEFGDARPFDSINSADYFSNHIIDEKIRKQLLENPHSWRVMEIDNQGIFLINRPEIDFASPIHLARYMGWSTHDKHG